MLRFDLLSDKNFSKKNILIKLGEHYLGQKSEELIRNNTPITEEVFQLIKKGYHQYVEDQRPLEYIIGKALFDNRYFILDERGMIPRPETEYMIQAVNEQLAGKSRVALLDLGTGSGVLGQSTWLDNPGVIDYLIQSDISYDAINLAKANAEQLGVHVSYFTQGSMLKPIDGEVRNAINSCSELVIVANLPYIPETTFDENVSESAKKREPRFAFIGGDDGLDWYRVLFEQLESKPFTIPVTMYLEMMTRQVERLITAYQDKLTFDIVKTFHFNIEIVRARTK